MKHALVILIAVLVVVPAFAAPKPDLSTPTVSCGASSTGASIDVTVTAGATGAPNGFTLHWMLKSEFLANGSAWPSNNLTYTSFCEGGFADASGHAFLLDPYEAVTVTVGDVIFDTPGASSACENVPLECGEEYVFRAFAKANDAYQKSAWSANTFCSTQSCGDDGCTYTQGYWKTHSVLPTGNNENEWPVAGLTLGSVTYTDFELVSIFNTSGKKGNGLVTLAHQLIAAKLNVANGADDSAIAATIAAADALIGGLVIPPVGSGFLESDVTSALTETLTNYNEGLIGPGHCDDEPILFVQ